MKKTTTLIWGFILMASPILSAEESDTNLPLDHIPLHKSDGGENKEEISQAPVAPPATSTVKPRSEGMGAWECQFERAFSQPPSIPSGRDAWENLF